jgi:hypothetical protein
LDPVFSEIAAAVPNPLRREPGQRSALVPQIASAFRRITRFEATESIARSQQVLGIVGTERRLVPGGGANDVFVPPPIPPQPPIPMNVN